MTRQPRRRASSGQGRVVLRGGPPAHPLVFSKRVAHVDRDVTSGDVALVCTREGEPIGHGFYHASSQIAVRMLSRDMRVRPDPAWLRAKLQRAHELRTELLSLPAVTDAWRAVHAEADGLSGLVVDRYGDVAVASLFSLGWFRRFDDVVAALKEVLGVKDVYMRVDPRTEQHEGFQAVDQRAPKPFLVREHGLSFMVDVLGGHKTGYFLDQRDNRRRIHDLAKGRRVFDGMTYTGGFALAAAQGGAESVEGMDLDEKAIAVAKKNADANKLKATFVHGDVFHRLRDFAGRPNNERPDLLIVDPAKWAKNRNALPAARSRYFDLNRLAFRAVRTGGLVFTHSCSGLLSEEDFLQILRNASLDANRNVNILSISGAAPDHPVSLRTPETRYLKSVLCVVERSSE